MYYLNIDKQLTTLKGCSLTNYDLLFCLFCAFPPDSMGWLDDSLNVLSALTHVDAFILGISSPRSLYWSLVDSASCYHGSLTYSCCFLTLVSR